MKFREHRGSLEDSMATLFEFDTAAPLMAHINERYIGAAIGRIMVSLYMQEPDRRIGWDRTYVITSTLYGVVGFTNGWLDSNNDPC